MMCCSERLPDCGAAGSISGLFIASLSAKLFSILLFVSLFTFNFSHFSPIHKDLPLAALVLSFHEDGIMHAPSLVYSATKAI